MHFNISKPPSQQEQSCSLFPSHWTQVHLTLPWAGRAGDEEGAGGKSLVFTGQNINDNMQSSPWYFFT